MNVRLPCPHRGSLDIDINGVDLVASLLLGLCEQRKYFLVIDRLSNCITDNLLYWNVKFLDRHGDLYWIQSSVGSSRTQAQIDCLHRHFFHPSLRKIYELLKR